METRRSEVVESAKVVSAGWHHLIWRMRVLKPRVQEFRNRHSTPCAEVADRKRGVLDELARGVTGGDHGAKAGVVPA